MLPLIESTTTHGRQTTFSYGADDPAILMGDFGARSLYVVCSKRLAVDIYAKNASYDIAHLKRGLTDGWLILLINPELYVSMSNPLAAIRAAKSDEVIPSGWYRLLVIPEWGSRR